MFKSILQEIKNELTASSHSLEGVETTRKFCVGDVTEKIVWFEVCTPEKEDFRNQYAIPKQDCKYSPETLERLSKFSENDRTIYKVTLKSDNEKGTRWLFKNASPSGKLSRDYVKGQFHAHC
jgi:hypothetical protein